MLHEQRHRAESFGAVAQQYDRSRPTYPDELIDELLSRGARSALDVGCGTGIAGALLAARGVSVLGVEVDERMAEIARGKGLEVEVGRFEDWDRRRRVFDLLTAGQSWHWVEPVAGAKRAGEALANGGRIGLFWNIGTPPPHVQARFDPIYERLGPDREGSEARLAARGEASLAALRECGAFSEPTLKRFEWVARYDTRSWLEQLGTQSDHQTLEPERRQALLAAIAEAIDDLGGSLEIGYQTLLVTAERV